MASSIGECLTFLCDEVLIDGKKLLPLDPSVNFILLRVNVNAKLMQFVYKETHDLLAEECELIVKWEHITATLISNERDNNLVTFNFNKNLCGHYLCNLTVSNVVFERLNSVIDIMYFTIMNTQYGIPEDQARERIRNVYVMEDDGFGYEEDLLASGSNNVAANANGNVSPTLSIKSLSDLDSEFESSSSDSDSSFDRLFKNVCEKSSDFMNNKKIFKNVPVAEKETIEEKTEEVEPAKENGSNVQLVIEEKAEEIGLAEKNDSIVQLAIDEKVEQVAPMNENGTIVQLAVGEKTEDIEPQKENETMVQLPIEGKTEEIEEKAE